MLRSLRDLIGYPVKALDGKAGKVSDCLFDDRGWRVCYLLVDTRAGVRFNIHYLSEEEDPERRYLVLIQPEDLEMPEMGSGKHAFPVHLTKEEVVHSPGFELDAPVELRYKWEFTQYLKHAPYERPEVANPARPESYEPPASNYDHDPNEAREHVKRIQDISHSHLHSVSELFGYAVEGMDGDIGAVCDFVLDVNHWEIRNLVVERGRWPFTKRNQLSVLKVANLDWTNQKISVECEKADLEVAPRFDPSIPVNRDEVERRYDYNGQPHAWKKTADTKAKLK